MLVWKSYKYRLKPTKEQIEILNRYIDDTRSVWNKALELQRQRLNENKSLYSVFELETKLNLRSLEDEDVNDIDIQPFSATLKDQETALKKFLDRKINFPMFKNVRKGGSLKFHTKFKVARSKIELSNIGSISFVKHRELDGIAKRVTILKSADKWYVSFLLLKNVEEPARRSSSSVGIDLGLTPFATLSDGRTLEGVNSLGKIERRIFREHRKLVQKVKGSKNWEKQRLKVEKLYIKAANARTDFLHKASRKIADEYSFVVIEDLEVTRLAASQAKPEAPGPKIRNPKLSRSILDQGWYRWRLMLDYKIKAKGGTFKVINPRNTSIKCSQCSYTSDLNRSKKNFHCGRCGHCENADLNAAKNILAAGRAASACGTSN